MEDGFLDAARRGRHTPARYLLGILIAFLYWQVAGSAAAFIIARRFAPPLERLSETAARLLDPGSFGPIRGFLLINAVHPFLLMGLFVVVLALHRRPMLTLITAGPGIRWRRVGQGFALWFGLSAAGGLGEYLLVPETFAFTWDPALFLPFLPLALLLTPLQTTAEELFFRGYLIQGLSLVGGNRLFLAAASGLLFALTHFANPEMHIDPWLMPLSYFLTGVLLALCSLRDGSLELVIGAHAANNLFGALIVRFEGSIFATPTLFFTTHYDPLASLIALLVMAAVFYAVFFARQDWRGRSRGRDG